MKQQILLIDDSVSIHSLVTNLLTEEETIIHSAMDGEYGLTLAESILPDLILLDVDMPGIDGYEVCRQLKADRKLFNIPVIFLTSHCTPAEKVKGLELGAVDYITKPFVLSELLARVRSALRTHRAIQMLEKTALIDFLTGLGNTAMFKQRLAAEVALRIRTSRPMSCIVLDVDNFQEINDVHGHPFGDRVLQTIGETIKTTRRTEDVACRLGADSFVILTPETDAADAATLAEDLQKRLTGLKLNNRGVAVEIFCSVSVAPAIETYDRSIVERAMKAMQDARESGQKGVAVASARVLAA